VNAQSLAILCVLAGILFESIGQALFKRATHRVRHGDTKTKAIRRVFKNWPWIAGGVALCLSNNFFYTVALYRLPLSLAFPLESLELVTMAILSRVFLGEAVGKKRWIATGMIVVGSVLVTWNG
jgi:drug/metabolite transporter (DMT)-like permease